MRKPFVALGTAALLTASSLALTIGTASDAMADRAYCKAMFGSAEPLLYQGIQGNTLAVQELQCELDNWKPSLNLAVDGKFGPATYSAVVTFQKWAGLDPDGKVGWYTWTKLDYWCDHLQT